MEGLQGRIAVVTGGSQGIGRAIVEGLCEAGVVVNIIDNDINLAENVAALKKQGYSVNAYKEDLSKLKNIPKLCEKIENEVGPIDILVNNVGIHKPGEAFNLSVQDFKKILNLNVYCMFSLSKEIAKFMSARNYGKIVNVASVLSVRGGYNSAAYSASKGAVSQLTKSLCNEWASKGININAIAPGYFETKLNEFILDDDERYQSLINRIPTQRFGNTNELKGIVKFLSSMESSYINGTVIPVDGGFLAR